MAMNTLPDRLLACAEELGEQRTTADTGVTFVAADVACRAFELLTEAAAALSVPEGRCKTVIVYGDRGPEEREPVEDYYTTPQPGDGVVVPDFYAAYVAYAARALEMTGSECDRLNSLPLRDLEKLLTAAPSAKGV